MGSSVLQLIAIERVALQLIAVDGIALQLIAMGAIMVSAAAVVDDHIVWKPHDLTVVN
jgi:hypothetical protein